MKIIINIVNQGLAKKTIILDNCLCPFTSYKSHSTHSRTYKNMRRSDIILFGESTTQL